MPALRRIDILNREAACGRISEVALKAGRWLQIIYRQQEEAPGISRVRNLVGASGEQLLRDILSGRSLRSFGWAPPIA